QDYSEPTRHRSGTVQPLRFGEAAHIEDGGPENYYNGEADKIHRRSVSGIPRHGKQRTPGREIQNARQEGQRSTPISPPGHKSCERPKSALSPGAKAAFLRISRRQKDDRDRD